MSGAAFGNRGQYSGMLCLYMSYENNKTSWVIVSLFCELVSQLRWLVTQLHVGEATSQFIKKNEWPPQRPDCNAMDYAIWDFQKKLREKLTE